MVGGAFTSARLVRKGAGRSEGPTHQLSTQAERGLQFLGAEPWSQFSCLGEALPAGWCPSTGEHSLHWGQGLLSWSELPFGGPKPWWLQWQSHEGRRRGGSWPCRRWPGTWPPAERQAWVGAYWAAGPQPRKASVLSSPLIGDPSPPSWHSSGPRTWELAPASAP